MNQETNENCPHCGATENVIGVQGGYATVHIPKKLSLKEEALYHIICLKCGTVIRSFVKKPENLNINK